MLRATPFGKSNLFTVTGSFPHTNISVGLRVKFNGDWQDHPTYGKEFHASTAEIIPEKGRSGIVSFLSSNVPSIGVITAAKLYDTFGDSLVEVLEKTPEKILELKYLTKTQSEAIINEWKHASSARTASIFLADLGLNSNQIKSVYTKFGVVTQDRIRENPYCLYQCPGVGFSTTDAAARKLGITVDDSRRMKAIVLYILFELSQSDGHMYGTTAQIYEYASKLFKRRALEPFSHGEYISDSHYYPVLSSLKASGDVIVYPPDRIYLRHHFNHEVDSSEALSRILVREPREFPNLNEILQEFEIARNVELSEEQKQAFLTLQKSRVCVISGYPGTGKTLLVSAFVYLFDKLKLDYVLTSPTGIAAKRLSQVTGKPASTIHRVLGYGKDGEWEFNAANKFHVDAICLDEASMLDGATFYHLMTALHPNTILIMIGDSAQLPSVGAGYVLNNLMNCPDVPHVSLTRIYRQEKQSDIIKVAHKILRNEPVNTTFNKDSQFVFVPLEKEDVVGELCKLTSKMKDRGSDFQVIAPMYDGDLGVNNLNRELRKILNPDFALDRATKLKHGEVDLYEGDRIRITKNDYDKMIFNGDVGKIQRISPKDDEVEVRIFDWFDQTVSTYMDKVFTFKIEEVQRMLRVAFACTVHSSQGKEYDFVILPMTRQYSIMLYRNLIYTAITRAKKKVFLFGDPSAFTLAVSNFREIIRNSGLRDMISEKFVELGTPDGIPRVVNGA